MTYPRFRLKIVLCIALVTISVMLIQTLIERYTLVMLYGGIGINRVMFDLESGNSLLNKLLFILPGMIAVGAIIWIFTNPLHRFVAAIAKGTHPAQTDYYRARKVVIRLPWFVIALNLITFLLGNVLGSTDLQNDFLTLQGLIERLQQLATAGVSAFVEITIINLILVRPKAMLKIHYIDAKRREKDMSLRLRTGLLSFFLSSFLMLSIIQTSSPFFRDNRIYIWLLERVTTGEITLEQAKTIYETETLRDEWILMSPEQLTFPMELSSAVRFRTAETFLIVFFVLIGLAFLVQYASSKSQTGQLKLLKRRLEEIVAGEGDMTERIEITQFDEIGELSDRVNRLMDKLAERNRYERKLREAKEASEASLALAQDVAGLGSWEIDLATETFTFSDAFCRLIGFEPIKDKPSLESVLNGILPEDRASLQTCISELIDRQKSYSIDIRTVHSNEQERAFHLRGEAQLDENGKAVRAIGTMHDITERKKSEQEMMEKEVALQSAREASRAKSAFLANMSHELRTPLNAVISMSDILLEKYFGELASKQEDYIKDIKDSGLHLLSLINDILDLSKVEAGQSPLELDEVQLGPLLEHCLGIVKEKALKHGIQLSCDVKADMDSIVADERKLKQVAYNLLANAVKFTPDGGQVGIEADIAREAGEQGWIKVCVWDTGIGIAQEDQERVFGEFAQAEATLTKKYEGTGLGLALVKRIVEQHGGRVWLESKPGEGSRFFFNLPPQAAGGDEA